VASEFRSLNDDQILISSLNFSGFKIFTIAWSLAKTKFSMAEKENTRTDFDNG
jgi:hypothetical protein